MSEFEGFGQDPEEPSEGTPPAGVPPEVREDVGGLAALPLVRASDLIAEEDLDQGDYTPDGRYKNFEIVAKEDWPDEPRHSHLDRRFYVRSITGVLGLVPWDGSQIVWPWEAAWHQDLHKETVQSFLKEDPKAKRK